MSDFGSGRSQEIIIRVLPRAEERQPSMFGGGGIYTYEYDRLAVWCDHGYKSLFEKVAGVFTVKEDSPEPHYLICVDPRYNLKWVMAEIEAVVHTQKPPKKRKKQTSGLTASDIVFTLSNDGLIGKSKSDDDDEE